MKKTILTLTLLSITLTACSDKEPPKNQIPEVEQSDDLEIQDLKFLPVTLTKVKQDEIQNKAITSPNENQEWAAVANNLTVNKRPVDITPVNSSPVETAEDNTPPTADTKTDTKTETKKDKTKDKEEKQNNTDGKTDKVRLKIGNTFSHAELRKRYPSPMYKSFTFDVNNDGKRDLIIASARYSDKKGKHSGDDLFVFLADNAKKYRLDLISTNFDTNSSLAFSGIMPRADSNGFILTTALADSFTHTHVQDYMFSKKGSKWWIHEFVSKVKMVKNDSYCKEKVSYNATDGTGNFQPSKKMKNCPLPSSTYIVTAKKAEILNDKFLSNNPVTYFIKGDIIEQNDIYFKQNEEWIYATYKNGKKSGWVRKNDLKKVVKTEKPENVDNIVTPPKDTNTEKDNDKPKIESPKVSTHKYKVISDKAEIVKEDFTPNNPRNYFVKGDMVAEKSIHANKNSDWIFVTYKDGKKTGWLSRKDLEGADNYQIPAKKYQVISDKAEIVKEDFTPNNPRNYFVKGDMIEEMSIHFNKNPGWIFITYKNGKKMGWVKKEDLQETQ